MLGRCFGLRHKQTAAALLSAFKLVQSHAGRQHTQALHVRELLDADLSAQICLQGAEKFQTPVHLQVSETSKSAQQAVEKAGGSVTTVYYNQLGLRALLTPDFFTDKGRQLPRPARPLYKVAQRYDRIGELPPKVALPVQSH